MNLTQNTTAVAIMNQAFGNDWLDNITDAFGYQTSVVNPDYIHATYNQETLEVITEAVGEEFIENPTDRTAFLDVILLDKGLQGVLDRMLEVDVQKYRSERKVAFVQAREAIKSTITTQVG